MCHHVWLPFCHLSARRPTARNAVFAWATGGHIQFLCHTSVDSGPSFRTSAHRVIYALVVGCSRNGCRLITSTKVCSLFALSDRCQPAPEHAAGGFAQMSWPVLGRVATAIKPVGMCVHPVAERLRAINFDYDRLDIIFVPLIERMFWPGWLAGDVYSRLDVR